MIVSSFIKVGQYALYFCYNLCEYNKLKSFFKKILTFIIFSIILCVILKRRQIEQYGYTVEKREFGSLCFTYSL